MFMRASGATLVQMSATFSRRIDPNDRYIQVVVFHVDDLRSMEAAKLGPDANFTRSRFIRYTELFRIHLHINTHRRCRISYLFHPGKAQLVHFHRQLEQIVQTLTLSLGLGHIVSPDVAVKHN